MVASEAAPLAKTGGLADVVGALPSALHGSGDEVAVVIPRYESIDLQGARRVWDIWLDMPWNKAIPPKLTETAAKHCETLSQVEISKDIIFKVLNFAKTNDRNGFYDGKSKELGHVVSEYSRWKSVEYQVQLETPEKPKVTVGNRAMQSFTFK